MNTRLLFKSLLLLLAFTAFTQTSHAYAEEMDSYEALTGEELQEIEVFKDEVKNELSQNFEGTVAKIAAKGRTGNSFGQSERDVILQGLYEKVVKKSKAAITEQAYAKTLNSILNWMTTGKLPLQAITGGVMAQLGGGFAGAAGGGRYGYERNFYIEDGSLKMMDYRMAGGNAGAGSPVVAELQTYVAFCFGSCAGGAKKGWYAGIDASGVAAIGAGTFIEVGLDAAPLLFKKFKQKQKITKDDFWAAATLYIGYEFNAGVGIESMLGVYRYWQAGPEHVLFTPNQPINPVQLYIQFEDLEPFGFRYSPSFGYKNK